MRPAACRDAAGHKIRSGSLDLASGDEVQIPGPYSEHHGLPWAEAFRIDGEFVPTRATKSHPRERGTRVHHGAVKRIVVRLRARLVSGQNLASISVADDGAFGHDDHGIAEGQNFQRIMGNQQRRYCCAG
jgi:hypothetical protein